MARLFGYHHIVFPDGQREDMVVVALDDEGRYLSHRPLRGEMDDSVVSFVEEPFVEWVGGTLEVRK